MIDKGRYYQWYETGYLEWKTRAWKEETVAGTIATKDGVNVASGGARWTL